MLKTFFDKIEQRRQAAEMGKSLADAVHEQDWLNVRYLIDLGADVHVSDDLPLRMAVLCGQKDIVQKLLEKGANIKASNYEAFQWAYAQDITRGSPEIFNIICDWAKKKNIKLPETDRDIHPERYAAKPVTPST